MQTFILTPEWKLCCVQLSKYNKMTSPALRSFPLKKPFHFHQMNPDVNSTKHRAPTTIAIIIETETFFSPFEQTLESVQSTARNHTDFYTAPAIIKIGVKTIKSHLQLTSV